MSEEKKEELNDAQKKMAKWTKEHLKYRNERDAKILERELNLMMLNDKNPRSGSDSEG